jgi:hypothetical protein
VVFATLADLESHLEWAGNRAPKKARLLMMDAPEGQAGLGTEFSSTGSDPMGSFADHSVVTEAIPGRVFEYVTEARLTPKRGGEPVEWTLVHRYEIVAHEDGSRISYTIRITRLSRVFGMLRMFRSPLVGLLMRVWASTARSTLRNLAAVSHERSTA